jgi:hypothetical protein
MPTDTARSRIVYVETPCKARFAIAANGRPSERREAAEYCIPAFAG